MSKRHQLYSVPKKPQPGLLIFCAVVEPRNSVKSTKTQKIPWNWVEILSNTCLYNISETYFNSYRGYLLAINLQIFYGTWSLKRANNVLKLLGVDYVAKNWALAMMLKALPLVHFWSVLLLKEQMMTSVRKTLKMLVWSVQNCLIPSEIYLENNPKIGHFFTDCFLVRFAPKTRKKFPRNRLIFLRICPLKSREIWLFLHDLSEALHNRSPVKPVFLPIAWLF